MNSIKDLLQAISDNPSVEVRIYANPHNHSVRVMMGTVTRKSGHEFLMEELNQRVDSEERAGYVLSRMLKELYESPHSNHSTTTI
jgi:hypothetical protein